MGIWYFATTGSPQHVAHDTPTLMTNAEVPPGAFYAFPNILLPPPAFLSNNHYTVNANQSGDSSGLAYTVAFVCTPVTTGEFQIGFYNLTGETIPPDTAFTVAFTCVGD
jgi:hypothetical protein